jgi:hypothetical protein
MRVRGALVAASGYAALHEAVDSLRERAAEPNVFAEPVVVGAAARSGVPMRVALAWHDVPGATPRLVGAVPVTVEPARPWRPVARLSARPHPYAVLSTPLVDRDHAEPAIAAVFDVLSNEPTLPRVLALPYLGDDGPVRSAIDAVIRRSGRALTVLDGYDRGRLDARFGGGAAFLEARFTGAKRKKHRYERRRLDATFTRHRGAGAVAAFAEFLAIEAAGWKGQAGTAVLCDPTDTAFMRDVISGLAATDRVEIAALRRGTRAIAIGVVFESGGARWFHKIAYDEAEARFSPGTHLGFELTTALLDTPGFTFADSCALRGAGMLEGTWTDRQLIADVLIDLVPGGGRSFALAVATERLRRAVRGPAKRVYHRLRKHAR